MDISQNGINLIKQFEGFSALVYMDVAGVATIGYGHAIKNGEVFSNITQMQAEDLLAKDCGQAVKAVSRLIAASLSQNQFDALVSFTFNLGGGALQRSSLRRKLNRGEYSEVPCELMRWVYAGGMRVRGLMRRRAAEATLFTL